MFSEKKKKWGKWGPTWLCGSQFTGKTLGIVGLGRIGEAIGHRLRAFGIDRIVYSGRSEKKEAQDKLNAKFVSFDTLLKESDVIAVSCALTKETENMFNYESFSKMKKSVVSIIYVFLYYFIPKTTECRFL